MGKDVIIALDFPGRAETLAFLDRFTGKKPFVKVGMELFYAEGPQIVREIKPPRPQDLPRPQALRHPQHRQGRHALALAAGREHDQPPRLRHHLHDGGRPRRADPPGRHRPLLIAVTQLTSTDQMRMEKELLIEKPLPDVVMHYAQLARTAGLDGVVCSPLEAGEVHKRCGADFCTVTPGVRFAGGDAGDQKRVTHPGKGPRTGLGLHRRRPPHHQAEDPVEAYERCLQGFVG